MTSQNKNFIISGVILQHTGKLRLQEANFDPIESALKRAVVYWSTYQSHTFIVSRYRQFQKYISMCQPVNDPIALKMIDELREYIGASTTDKLFYNSDIFRKTGNVELLSITVQCHWNWPFDIKTFTQQGFCKICFATSTLEQGINMPFDVVYLDRFEESKTLSVKNLIGRAGSTNKPDIWFW